MLAASLPPPPSSAVMRVRVCGGSGAVSVSRSLITQTVLFRSSSTLPPPVCGVQARVSESVQPEVAVSRRPTHGRNQFRRLVTRMLAASLTPPPSSAVTCVSICGGSGVRVGVSFAHHSDGAELLTDTVVNAL